MTDPSPRVYAKVVADLLHPGHVRFFKAARALGAHLTVCVVPDERVAAYKGVPPLFTLVERVEMVASCRWVDDVISACPKEITPEFMQERGFDIYAFGAKDAEELEIKLLDCKGLPPGMRVRIPYAQGVSSSMLRERIMARASHEVE